ncbi:hypothetical protein BJ508DRAFT_412873, partial [Ascobolus immersus RN42]
MEEKEKKKSEADHVNVVETELASTRTSIDSSYGKVEREEWLQRKVQMRIAKLAPSKQGLVLVDDLHNQLERIYGHIKYIPELDSPSTVTPEKLRAQTIVTSALWYKARLKELQDEMDRYYTTTVGLLGESVKMAFRIAANSPELMLEVAEFNKRFPKAGYLDFFELLLDEYDYKKYISRLPPTPKNPAFNRIKSLASDWIGSSSSSSSRRPGTSCSSSVVLPYTVEEEKLMPTPTPTSTSRHIDPYEGIDTSLLLSLVTKRPSPGKQATYLYSAPLRISLVKLSSATKKESLKKQTYLVETKNPELWLPYAAKMQDIQIRYKKSFDDWTKFTKDVSKIVKEVCVLFPGLRNEVKEVAEFDKFKDMKL